MIISILVIDDSRPIAEGFAGKFRRFSAEHFNVNAVVEVLHSFDDSVRRLLDRSKPELDLVFADIDLSGGDVPDKAGVAFARFAGSQIPKVPIVGYSGLFGENDLTEFDLALFDKCWPKGGSSSRLDEIARDAIQRAIVYHQSKFSKLETPESQSAKVLVQMNSIVTTQKTNEEFISQGYVMKFIDPSAKNGLVEPFAVWEKEGAESVAIEVVGCPSLYAKGDTFNDAEYHLIEVIHRIRDGSFDREGTFSPTNVNEIRFVETVTGARASRHKA